MCEIITGLRNFLLLNRQKTLLTTGSRAIALTPTQRRNSSFASTHQSETVNTTWSSIWITVVKSEGVGISDEKQGRPRIVSGLELDVHHKCRGWRRWFQFFQQRDIPIALIFLLPFGPLFEHHDTSNSPLQIPHPDLSYPFRGSLLLQSIRPNLLGHQRPVRNGQLQFCSRSKTSRSAVDRSPCRLLCPTSLRRVTGWIHEAMWNTWMINPRLDATQVHIWALSQSLPREIRWQRFCLYLAAQLQQILGPWSIMSEVWKEEQMTKDLLKVESGGQVCLHRWDRSLLTGSSAAEVTAAAFRACLSTRDGLLQDTH